MTACLSPIAPTVIVIVYPCIFHFMFAALCSSDLTEHRLHDPFGVFVRRLFGIKVFIPSTVLVLLPFHVDLSLTANSCFKVQALLLARVSFVVLLRVTHT